MLYNLIERLKQDFLEQGGIREEMTRGRLAFRSQQQQPSQYSAKDAELIKREKAVAAKESELAEKERRLAEREKELSIREDEIRRLLK